MAKYTVAVIGGGQLARMMQHAAVALNIHLRALVESDKASAAQVIPDAPVGSASDVDAVMDLTDGADVLTFEHEHVPPRVTGPVAKAGTPVRTRPEALTAARDKIVMRRKLTQMGVPCPRWTTATTTDDVVSFADQVGWPIVVKTARGGYDGKGVRVLDDAASATAELTEWITNLADGDALLVEEAVDFSIEVAALVARRPSGEMASWPLAQTVQRGGVCAEVIAPAPGLDETIVAQADDIARTIAEQLDVTGVLAVEMFVVPSRGAGSGQHSRVVVNELAMRPHNSGHWTIEGSVTSQFEQHLRAVLDLPLGSTAALAPASVMVNVLGSQLEDPAGAYPEVLAEFPRAKVHLYGKEVRPGRKLGHVTVVGDDAETLLRQARQAAAMLRGEPATDLPGALPGEENRDE